jgi:uncharacterized protein YcbK (DUF882 family)
MEPPFVAFVEKIRRQLGQPMAINSGCRCPKNNQAAGGSPKSAHLDGLAVDVATPSSGYAFDLVRLAMKEGALGIGVYLGRVHIDLKDRGAPVLWYGK